MTKLPPEIREFYLRQGPMTDPGDYRNHYASHAEGPGPVAATVQGLVLHEHVAPSYGVTLTDERRQGSQIRKASETLAAAQVSADSPITSNRPLEERAVGTCRTFSVLFTGLLRAQGVPTRARCGFATYFESGKGVDHWVGERWDDAAERWILTDAQLDGLQQRLFKVDFDPLDVPRDRFLVAGDAWLRVREGELDAANFGIMDMSGLWFIAGNVVRDVASLNGVEMLPWDVWGCMPGSDSEFTDESLAFFDYLARLTLDPDVNFPELRELYETDSRVRVPETVFNALRNQPEAVPA